MHLRRRPDIHRCPHGAGQRPYSYTRPLPVPAFWACVTRISSDLCDFLTWGDWRGVGKLPRRFQNLGRGESSCRAKDAANPGSAGSPPSRITVLKQLLGFVSKVPLPIREGLARRVASLEYFSPSPSLSPEGQRTLETEPCSPIHWTAAAGLREGRKASSRSTDRP